MKNQRNKWVKLAAVVGFVVSGLLTALTVNAYSASPSFGPSHGDLAQNSRGPSGGHDFNPRRDLPKWGDRDHGSGYGNHDPKKPNKPKDHKGPGKHHDNDDCDPVVEVSEPSTLGLALVGSALLLLGRRKFK